MNNLPQHPSASETLQRLQTLAQRLIQAFDPIRPVLRNSSLAATPKEFDVALGYILVSAYKTFRALCKVCDVEEPWGQQGLVFSRMLFESYVTAKWLAVRPSERSENFIEFEHIAEVQSALIKGEIDDAFFAQGAIPPSQSTQIHREFFRVLPKFFRHHPISGSNCWITRQLLCVLSHFFKMKDKQPLTKYDVLRIKWTNKSVHKMVKSLNETGLMEDYETLYTLSSSVVHTTSFAAHMNIADDLSYRWMPGPKEAVGALGYGLGYFLRLAVFSNERLHFDPKSVLEAFEKELDALHDTMN